MDRRWKPSSSLFLLLLLAFAPSRAYATTKTWSATPANGNWSNQNNWAGNVAPIAGDDLIFPAVSTIKSTTNDLASNISIASMTFNSNGYTLGGNAITLGAGGINVLTGISPHICTIDLPVVLGATIALNLVTGAEVDMTGVISGAFGLTMGPGDGVLKLSGTNTFTGVVTMNKGLLVVESAQALGTGDGTAGTGTVVASGGALEVSTSSTIANEALSVAGTGTGGSITGALYNSGTATWAGPITLPSSASIGGVGTGFTLAGVIDGAGGLTKVFTGALTLSGTNTYTGATTVNGGQLLVNGALSGTSGTSVAAFATLGGTGTIANPTSITSAGILAPGASPGALHTGNVSFAAGSTFTTELNGTTVGTQYDQLAVTGTVTLGGATLTPVVGFQPTPGDSFTIISNDGGDAVSGTFAGLAEGAAVIVPPYTFTISYVGGTGNDVVLTASATPTQLLTNGGFSNGLTNWQTFATPDPSYIVASVSSGVLQFSRVPPPPGTSNQATVFQTTGVAMPAFAPLLVQFDVANTSNVRKYLKVLAIDSDFSDLMACTFWLPANAPMRTYQMRTHTTEAWTNAALYFYAGTSNGAGDTGVYQVDNVSYAYAPAQFSDHTDCVDPLTPAPSIGLPGSNLLTNGDFGTSTLPPWTTFGTITADASTGVLQMIRPTSTLPAGVVLQPTTQAMTSAQRLTATFSLGNSSAVRKRVTAIMHDLDFSDLIACVFWLEPSQPLLPYSMVGWASKAWTNATLSFYAATIGPDQWTRVDNVVFQTTPSAITPGSTCTDVSGVSTVHADPRATAPVSITADANKPSPATIGATGMSADAGWVSKGGFAPTADLGAWLADSIDLRDADQATLHFHSWLSAGAARAAVQVRSASGNEWVTVAEVMPSDSWQALAIDLSPFVGDMVDVQFVVEGAASANLDNPDFWRIDDVRVEPAP